MSGFPDTAVGNQTIHPWVHVRQNFDYLDINMFINMIISYYPSISHFHTPYTKYFLYYFMTFQFFNILNTYCLYNRILLTIADANDILGPNLPLSLDCTSPVASTALLCRRCHDNPVSAHMYFSLQETMRCTLWH